MTTELHRQTVKFASVVLENLPVMSGASMQYWIEHSHASELQAVLSTLVRDDAERPPPFLGNRQIVDLPARPGSFNPDEFFVTRDGLYVWDGFRDRIVAAAKPTDGALAGCIASFDLLRNANDREIQSELPEDYVFEASEFLPHLAGLLERQWGGTAGPLLNSSYANIFYVRGIDGEVFAVDVDWSAVRREWHVDAGPLDAYRWDAGRRVFPRDC